MREKIFIVIDSQVRFPWSKAILTAVISVPDSSRLTYKDCVVPYLKQNCDNRHKYLQRQASDHTPPNGRKRNRYVSPRPSDLEYPSKSPGEALLSSDNDPPHSSPGMERRPQRFATRDSNADYCVEVCNQKCSTGCQETRDYKPTETVIASGEWDFIHRRPLRSTRYSLKNGVSTAIRSAQCTSQLLTTV